jgi:hypothetical protein
VLRGVPRGVLRGVLRSVRGRGRRRRRASGRRPRRVLPRCCLLRVQQPSGERCNTGCPSGAQRQENASSACWRLSCAHS